MGMKPEKTLELKMMDKKLSLSTSEEFITRPAITDVLAVQDALKIRSVALTMCELVPFDTSESWNQVLIRSLKQEVPVAMRLPTINEVRLVDRLVFDYVGRFAATRQSTLARGLAYFCSEQARNHELLSQLKIKLSTMPCQGVESKTGLRQTPAVVPEASTPATSGSTICTVCGKPRKDHENRRFCPRTQAERDRVAAAAKKKAAGRGKKGSGKGGMRDAKRKAEDEGDQGDDKKDGKK
jgi:hypothetical protein